MLEGFKNKNIALLRGGPSLEKDISMLSGEEVLKALRSMGLTVVDIIVPDKRDVCYLRSWVLDKLEKEKVSICFIALHGWFGEDGILQDILDKEGYRYTGSGSWASRAAMNKIESKIIFRKNLIPVLDHRVIESVVNIDVSDLDFPVLIKPSSQGSSIGVFKVEDRSGLEAMVSKALFFDGKVIIEEFLDAIELSVGILDDMPLPVIKIKSPLGVYDFKVKYTPGLAEYIVPADIKPDVFKKAQQLALKSHNSLECNCFSRIDMLYSETKDEIFVLELNTIPGLTKTSLLPKAARTIGIEFDELVSKMLQSALKREKCLKK